MKQKTISFLKKKADTLFSLEVRERDKFTCQKCGKQGKFVHCAHIFSRNSLSTRYDLRNAVTLCYYCHIIWAHRCPAEFTLWAKDKIGNKIFETLRKLSQKLVSDPRRFITDILEKYGLSQNDNR
jgi:5-methylcytosine-specific restriction endonuclease McrA